MKRRFAPLLPVCALALSLLLPAMAAALTADLEQQLAEATYVYIASTRKGGGLGAPAEIWFFYHDGAVYVGTRPESWRVKRIKAGRPQAMIWIGKPDGPSFRAKGTLVKDAALEKLLQDTYAKKYPQGWKRYADQFKAGFQDGSRVVVKYTPE